MTVLSYSECREHTQEAQASTRHTPQRCHASRSTALNAGGLSFLDKHSLSCPTHAQDKRSHWNASFLSRA